VDGWTVGGFKKELTFKKIVPPLKIVEKTPRKMIWLPLTSKVLLLTEVPLREHSVKAEAGWSAAKMDEG
jgi:hypothetical protein